jgi:hypothetical protein
MDSYYPVTQTVTIELYGLTLEVTGYVEPAQDGGRDDPSWDAYFVSQFCAIIDDHGQRWRGFTIRAEDRLAINEAVERQLKDNADNGPPEE